MARQIAPTRGDVWLVSLDPTVGHEIQKTRPAVVVTSNVYNRHSSVILVPLTAQASAAYDQVLVTPPDGGLSGVSVTLPEQLRPVDRRRLVRRMGRLRPKTVAAIDQSLRMVLDLF